MEEATYLNLLYIEGLEELCNKKQIYIEKLERADAQNIIILRRSLSINGLILPLKVKILSTKDSSSCFIEVLFELNKKETGLSQREILNIVNIHNNMTIDLNTSVFVDKTSYTFVFKKEQGFYAFFDNAKVTEKKNFIESFWSNLITKMSFTAACLFNFIEIDYTSKYGNISFTNFFSENFMNFFREKLFEFYNNLNKGKGSRIFVINNINNTKNINRTLEQEKDLTQITDLKYYKKCLDKLTPTQLSNELDKELVIYAKIKDDSKLKILSEYIRDKDNKK